MPATKQIERKYSVHYLTFGVMDRTVRYLSGFTPCCLPPPALDFRKPITVDVKARKLRFTAVTVPPEVFEQDSVVFGKLGDVPPGMVVLVVIGSPLSTERSNRVVQMIGREDEPRRSKR